MVSLKNKKKILLAPKYCFDFIKWIPRTTIITIFWVNGEKKSN